MTSPSHPSNDAGARPGQRLRAAREAAGLGISEVAARLRMPVRVVESLEADDGVRLGGEVFARGQLRSYARLLGLPFESVAAGEAAAMVRPSELKPRTYTSPLRRFADHASRRLVYVVITALIAVPVWMAARPHLSVPVQEGVALDVGPAATSPQPPQPRPAAAAEAARNGAPLQPGPVMASMAPRLAQEPALSLHVSGGDSWVQVSARDGRPVEEAVLRDGESRSYAAGEVGRVVLGNAGVVEVRHRGQVQDLAPHRRANVARFAVSSDGSPAAAD